MSWQVRSTLFHRLARRTEGRARASSDRNGQIARLVEPGEQRQRDRAIGGDGERPRRSCAPAAPRGFRATAASGRGRDRRAAAAACSSAAAERRRPAGIRSRPARGKDRRLRVDRVVGRSLRSSRFGARLLRPAAPARPAASPPLVRLQKRVLLQLGGDEALQLQPRHLQQANRLHQLRGNDQRLDLPALQPAPKEPSTLPRPNGLQASPTCSRARHIAVQLKPLSRRSQSLKRSPR